MYWSNYMNSKCLVNIFEAKKSFQQNSEIQLECKINNLIESKLNSLVDSNTVLGLKENINRCNEEPLNKILLKVYPKTVSIILNNNPGPNNYFIENSKLFKYDVNGQNPHLICGNFLITESDNPDYLNKSFKVSEENLQPLNTYFDGTNLKLVIDGIEEKTEGTLILTDDYKIFVRIGSGWYGK